MVYHLAHTIAAAPTLVLVAGGRVAIIYCHVVSFCQYHGNTVFAAPAASSKGDTPHGRTAASIPLVKIETPRPRVIRSSMVSTSELFLM